MPVVILKTRKGLLREQKRRIVREFTETLVRTTGITPELVTILIEEHELEDIPSPGAGVNFIHEGCQYPFCNV
jgi:4-oxalocrotonate tautomerase